MSTRTVHKCSPMVTDRRRRLLNLEAMIAHWVCGDYDGTPYKEKGEQELNLLVQARNTEVAVFTEKGLCRQCGYPK